VFPGSPLPYIKNGTTALFGERLSRLAHGIELENADVVCLQELYCNACRDFLAERFRHKYVLIQHDDKSRCGTAVGTLLVLCLCALSLLLAHFLFIESVIMLYVAYKLWRRSALDGFLFGNKSGLAIMYRADLFTLLEADPTHYFLEQRGDFMNWMAPRAWMSVKLVGVFWAFFQFVCISFSLSVFSNISVLFQSICVF